MRIDQHKGQIETLQWVLLQRLAGEEDPLEITLLSEQALAEFWDTPEEDEAWAYLQEYKTH